ncbi:sugar ABC transporter substrate-binding protein [Microvirga sp. BT689]|uniref:sugar ABC transporter substrate-binding protein n=1 Tax=Microvirga arvi TaxID=2778731 RepID=UPI001951BD97|nr:sugar ABC transporter substrate-binding protein [Microvirga arvi]MBM6584222.1 sugar ABC transporter substrate-binding protein [Microvirga arvi]
MLISRRTASTGLLALMLTLGLAAPTFAQGSAKVGMMISNLGLDPWMNVAISTIEKGAKAKGFQVTVADGRSDISQMAAAIDRFVVQDMDAIIIYAPDPDSLVGPVSSAIAKGVPVLAFSAGLSPEAKLTSYIKSDEVKMGREQAELVVKELGGKGNVALMMGVLGSSPQLGRSEGQHAVFSKHPNIKIVEEQSNEWAHDKTVALIQDWLSKYPKGKLDAVIAHGPELVAAAEYAKSVGRTDVKFVALDYPADVRKAIIDGTMLATVNQDPGLMGRLTVETLEKVLKGQTVEKEIVIETPMITKANAESTPAAYE